MTAPFPRIIAHRGFSAKAPENTLAAFRLALELGVDGVEFDVRFSRDLQVMIIHDDKLNRTTSGSGRVRDLDRQDIQSLDAGAWFSPQFAGETVPTLADLVSLVMTWQVELVLEIKPDPLIPPDFVDRILSAVPVFWFPRLVILSFDHSCLPAFSTRAPLVRRGALVNRRGDPVAAALDAGANVLALRRNLVSRRTIERAHQAGLEIMIWTVDQEQEMRRLADWRVDAIVTNHPDRALKVAQEVRRR